MSELVDTPRLPVKKRNSRGVPAQGTSIPSNRAADSAASAPTDATGGSAYDLGKLNRHWYRRCLDSLGRTLNASGASPTIEQLQELCDQVVTSFLVAVTGQSPDSDRPQFPADRAYYIPFASDRSGKFNFSKPYFQVLSSPDSALDQSLWSFLPWTKPTAGADGAAGKGRTDLGVDIDPESLDSNKQVTISFADLLKSPVTAGTTPTNRDTFRLRKSLLLRGKNEDILSLDNLKGILSDARFKAEVAAALLGIFEVYKAFPGNAAIEFLLLNHCQILQWLWQLASPANAAKADAGDGTQSDHGELFDLLLQTYFLEGAIDEKQNGIEKLRLWVTDHNETPLEEILESGAETPFRRGVRARRGLLGAVEREIKELHPHFVQFRRLLGADAEEKLESDLAASTPDDPRRAGTAKRSFVWVCADFAELESSLPEGFRARSSGSMTVKDAEEQLDTINLPYKTFFQELEAARLRENDYKDVISSYWRTRGEAARTDRVFGSFDKEDGSLSLPSTDVVQFNKSPRPQNIFLRVRICDSLNEPMIDGLFVFTTDHDEVKIKGKDADLRREDIEDLLAFGKVFFFIVRDHLHGLDRARESADIGRLNQHLYDHQLAELDKCMNERLSTGTFQRDGVTAATNWAKFTYEVLNNYAYSLIEKPEDVRNETFPYDRLLIVPLPEGGAVRGAIEDSDYSLPLYLFQALYVECKDQKIQKGMYSLLKPFQSPAEEKDEEVEEEIRFHARSFQEVSDAGGRKRRLEQYLQKHYVGAHEPQHEEGEAPASYVVKTVRGDGKVGCGKEWVEWALRRFWFASEISQRGQRLWLTFLCDLTESYRQLRELETAPEQEVMWFLCRYGLFRAALPVAQQDEPAFKRLENDYNHELSLRFGGNEELSLLGTTGSANRLEPLEVLTERKMIPDSPAQIAFVDYLLKSQDPWVVALFRTFTNLVANRDHEEKLETYYQDLLTRPVISADTDRNKHQLAASQIGERVPQYSNVIEGRDAIATFLGILNLTVGGSELDRRRLRCVIVMLRDYDDTKSGRVQSEAEAKKRLEVDRGDLTLYTRTFFQNVHRFLTTARERQQVRVLSTDITQIARSWYSNGVDLIVSSLQERLRDLVDGAEVQGLGRLRAEMIDSAFVSLLNVLIRPEKQRDTGKNIELESFPFDRIVHVPLLFGATPAARWCYARVTFENDKKHSTEVHHLIRQFGRHQKLKGGKKIIAPAMPTFFGPGEFFASSDAAHEAVRKLLRRLIERPLLLDRFIRRLNEADALQTLAVAGTMFHLLKQRDNATPGEQTGEPPVPDAGRLQRELRTVIERSVRSLEPEEWTTNVLTDAHMDRPAYLVNSPGDDDALFKLLGNVNQLPLLHELFEAVEGADYAYGLPDAKEGSKVFYVYYSLPAPDGFIEGDELDSRYRGVFCLVVDDARTDDKTSGDGLSDAEAADLDDIRTFVHNAMCNLAQVLRQQALQHQIRRPGIADDVIGMMHRLKNELNGPTATLSAVRRALAAAQTAESSVRILERTPELTERVDDATRRITAIQTLFQDMKRLSEHQQGQIPLQTFSSDWLAWTFLVKLSDACLNTIKKQLGDNGEKASTRAIDKLISEAKERLDALAGWSEASAAGNAKEQLTDDVEAVQRGLFELATLFATEYPSPAGMKIELLFGFDAFTADKPLEFSASYLIDEALNILIENAFQALLSYLEQKFQAHQPIVIGRIRFICRENPENESEILLDLRNSSSPLPPKLLEELNADPPRTVSSEIYAEVSGKKGGSGFGHYHARRIISEHCGGRQARRQLDIRLNSGPDMVRTQVRLLKPEPGGLRTIATQDLLRAVAGELKGAETLDGAQPAASDIDRYYAPRSIQLRILLRTIRQLLSEDAAMRLDDLASLCDHDVRLDLLRQAGQLRNRISARVNEAAAAHPGLRRWYDRLNDESICRQGSLHELSALLQEWRKTDEPAFRTMVSVMQELRKPGDEAICKQLDRISKGRGLNPAMLISKSRRVGFNEQFRPFAPYLRPTALTAGLEALIDSMDKLELDVNGYPKAKRSVLSEAFRRPRLAYRLRTTGSGLALDLWSDLPADESAPAPGEKHGRLIPLDPKELCDLFKRNMLGRTIAQYYDAFRSSGDDGRGALRVFRFETPSEGSPTAPTWKAEVVFCSATGENERASGENRDVD